MKKHLLTALGIGILGVTSYAATFMNVKTKDGESVKFDVDDVDEVIFVEDETPVDTIPVSSHSYVDLGLPSGTLWATYNIGATKPEEFGDYFAWGETSPKEVYDWSSYKYAITDEYGGLDSIMKYSMSGNISRKDRLSILLSKDDAATANWGSDWRMPTTEEQQELINNCQYEWTEVGGVSGAKFTASNGNSIFLPAAGRRGSDVGYVGDLGYYWSSSLLEKYEGCAHCLYFYESEAYWHFDSPYRFIGFPVRAVRAKKSDNIVLPADTTEIITPVDTTTKDTSVAVLPSDTTNIDTTSSNHSYVDLGLPSGTLWATYNIGATKPEEFGDYFAWGETAPKDVYDWGTYKYAISKNGRLDSLTKYNSGQDYLGVIDSLITLQPEDDAATANWGAAWRMPTMEEQQELIDNCEYSWTEIDGVKGGKFTASNGNFVFFPAMGRYQKSEILYIGNFGAYLSSSYVAEIMAYYLSIDNDQTMINADDDGRSLGYPVRAVRAKK